MGGELNASVLNFVNEALNYPAVVKRRYDLAGSTVSHSIFSERAHFCIP